MTLEQPFVSLIYIIVASFKDLIICLRSPVSVSHKLTLYPEAQESWATLVPKRAERICRKTGLNEFMLSFSPGEIKLTWFQPLSPLSDSWRSILPLGWPPDITFRKAESPPPPVSEPLHHTMPLWFAVEENSWRAREKRTFSVCVFECECAVDRDWVWSLLDELCSAHTHSNHRGLDCG